MSDIQTVPDIQSEEFAKQSFEEITTQLTKIELNPQQLLQFFTNVTKFHSITETISLLSILSLSSLNLELLTQLFSLIQCPFFQTASLLLQNEQNTFTQLKEENKKLTCIVSQIEDPKTNLFKAAKEGILELAKNAIEKDPTIVNATDELVSFFIFT